MLRQTYIRKLTEQTQTSNNSKQTFLELELERRDSAVLLFNENILKDIFHNLSSTNIDILSLKATATV